jgi:hypothetical protein
LVNRWWFWHLDWQHCLHLAWALKCAKDWIHVFFPWTLTLCHNGSYQIFKASGVKSCHVGSSPNSFHLPCSWHVIKYILKISKDGSPSLSLHARQFFMCKERLNIHDDCNFFFPLCYYDSNWFRGPTLSKPMICSSHFALMNVNISFYSQLLMFLNANVVVFLECWCCCFLTHWCCLNALVLFKHVGVIQTHWCCCHFWAHWCCDCSWTLVLLLFFSITIVIFECCIDLLFLDVVKIPLKGRQRTWRQWARRLVGDGEHFFNIKLFVQFWAIYITLPFMP